MSKKFSFKQFCIAHDKCAMKVGTDGVLLGAWTNCKNAANILDVGTGSGLIALMLAQRSQAQIQGIDIDKDASRQAASNFDISPFANRLQSIQGSFIDFQTDKKYDLIVSNPPYFVDSMKSPSKARNDARHNDGLSLSDLVCKSCAMLKPYGIISLILPFDSLSTIEPLSKSAGLYLNRKTEIKPLPSVKAKRVLLEYSFIDGKLEENELTIELSRHLYSPEYIKLCKDFYLAM